MYDLVQVHRDDGDDAVSHHALTANISLQSADLQVTRHHKPQDEDIRAIILQSLYEEV